MIMYSIAREGLFTRPPLTPIESVDDTPLHDVLRYMEIKIRQDEKNKK